MELEIEDLVSKDYYFLAMDFNDENNPFPHELFERENILNDLKAINKELKNDLDYLELCEQSVSLIGKFELKKDFEFREFKNVIKLSFKFLQNFVYFI